MNNNKALYANGKAQRRNLQIPMIMEDEKKQTPSLFHYSCNDLLFFNVACRSPQVCLPLYILQPIFF